MMKVMMMMKACVTRLIPKSETSPDLWIFD